MQSNEELSVAVFGKREIISIPIGSFVLSTPPVRWMDPLALSHQTGEYLAIFRTQLQTDRASPL